MSLCISNVADCAPIVEVELGRRGELIIRLVDEIARIQVFLSFREVLSQVLAFSLLLGDLLEHELLSLVLLLLEHVDLHGLHVQSLAPVRIPTALLGV